MKSYHGWPNAAATPLKRVFGVLNGSTPKADVAEFWDGDIAWATPDDLGDLDSPVLNSTRRSITAAGYGSCGTAVAPAGSLILSTRAPIGHLAIAARPMCTNQGCRALVPRSQIHPKFFYYQLLAAKPVLQSLGNGSTFKELSKQSLEQFPVWQPVLPTQEGIAAFLDRETSKIDAVISARERHIELIGEEFEARVDAAMSRAGDLIKLRRLWSEVDYGISETGRVGGVFPVLTMGDIHEGVVSVPNGEGVDSVDQRLLLRPGDLLFNRTNSRELVGKVGLYRGPAGAVTFASYLVRLRCTDLIHPEYANLLLNSRSVLAEARSRALLSVNQANLNPNRYSEIEVRLPSVAVQAGLLKELADARRRLSDLRQTINIAVERLREYRGALITAAVTGQIDVRSHAS